MQEYACSLKNDFMGRVVMLIDKLIMKGYKTPLMKKTLGKCLHRHPYETLDGLKCYVVVF